MTDTTGTPTLEQTLNKTDLGHTIYENRKILFGILVAILVGALAYVAMKQVKHSSALENSKKVFEFQTGAWADAKTGKVDSEQLVKAFKGLEDGVQAAPVMLPIVLEMSKFLSDKGEFAEAESILSEVSGAHKHPVASFFVRMQRAVVLEKLGKVDEAISVLEPLAQGKDAIMPAKTSVALGRLYLAKGEKGKAQTQFDYVLNNFPNDVEAKVAKLYLAQLAQ
jgi:predicted negative regulator of RcsB-dependent stress response